MDIAAIVVTYFPNEILLVRLLRSIGDEVKKIYVIDNTPNGSKTWLNSQWLSEFGLYASYHGLGENFGIAKAQNIGIDLAVKDGCDHVILFDQDSAPPRGMINNLANTELKMLAAGLKVGSVGPLFLDEKTNGYSQAIRHSGLMVHKVKVSPDDSLPVIADHLIASGSLIRVSIFQEVGVMREELFIDWVDIEWGLRAGSFGYQHFIIPKVVMLHSIGDEFVSFGNRQINLHSDTRNYYIVRNACYLLTDSSVNWQWRASIFFKVPKYVIFYSITTPSKKRGKIFMLLLKACSDGFLGKLGKAF
jgi:rhamnosyltransferase